EVPERWNFALCAFGWRQARFFVSQNSSCWWLRWSGRASPFSVAAFASAHSGCRVLISSNRGHAGGILASHCFIVIKLASFCTFCTYWLRFALSVLIRQSKVV